jgi:glycosyltransferase involved in cell wall biosynthesis
VKADVSLTGKYRVLFVTHQLAKSKYGGVETQMLKTMEAVNSTSTRYECSLFHPWDDDINDFDLVHIFNPRAFPLEALYFGNFAKNHGLRLVTTPIFYHRASISHEKGRGFAPILIEKFSGDFRRLFRTRRFAYADPYNHLGELLRRSDLVLPNTVDERNLLLEFFDLSEDHIFQVPNATDMSFAEGDPALAQKTFGAKDYVLFVGRIEPQKNILRLIRAFKRAKLGTKLIIMGKTIDNRYAADCRAEASSDVIFAESIDHDSEMLRSAYKGAKVVALPSYYETPGLVGLEGGLAGANIVITRYGGPQEYLRDMAYYVEPTDEKSIQTALERAYRTARTDRLSRHIAANYNWEVVGQKTAEAYRMIS